MIMSSLITMHMKETLFPDKNIVQPVNKTTHTFLHTLDLLINRDQDNSCLSHGVAKI